MLNALPLMQILEEGSDACLLQGFSKEALYSDEDFVAAAQSKLVDERSFCMSHARQLSQEAAFEAHCAMKEILQALDLSDHPYELYCIEDDWQPPQMHDCWRICIAWPAERWERLQGAALVAGLCSAVIQSRMTWSRDARTLFEMGLLGGESGNGLHPELFAENRDAIQRCRLERYVKTFAADRMALEVTGDLLGMLNLLWSEAAGCAVNACVNDIGDYEAVAQALCSEFLLSGFLLEEAVHPGLRLYALIAYAKTAEGGRYSHWPDAHESVEALNQSLATLLSAATVCPRGAAEAGEKEDLDRFALAASVLIAYCDGNFADEEAQVIESIYCILFQDYRAAFKLDEAFRILRMLSPNVRRMTMAESDRLWMRLWQVIRSDGEFQKMELQALQRLGDLVGQRERWMRLFAVYAQRIPDAQLSEGTTRESLLDPVPPARDPLVALREALFKMAEQKARSQTATALLNGAVKKGVQIAYDQEGDEWSDAYEETDAERVIEDWSSAENRAKAEQAIIDSEARDAISLYCEQLCRWGFEKTSLERLLRTMGLTYDQKEMGLVRLLKYFKDYQIEATPPITRNLSLSEEITLRALAHVDEIKKKRAKKPIDSATALLIRAFKRLQSTQINGDGRSRTVRCRERRGKLVDLFALNAVKEGRAEQLILHLCANQKVELVSPRECGELKQARKLSLDLEELYRQARLNLDETGHTDLYVGSLFLTGQVEGYGYSAPLALYPVAIQKESGASSGFVIERTEEDPEVNFALLRMIAGRMKGDFELKPAIEEKLSDALLQGEPALQEAIRELGLIRKKDEEPTGEFPASDGTGGEAHGALISLIERASFDDDGRCTWGRIEPCLVIGIFSQSQSEMLREYVEIIDALESGEQSSTEILGSIETLLPSDLRSALWAEKGNVIRAERSQVSEKRAWPLVELDPSQREALMAAGKEPAIVIDGPPGTGKSQVIVGIVLDALEKGQTVAVLSDKRAAIDVVGDRLQKWGFGDCFAIVHHCEKDRNALYAKIASRMASANSLPPQLPTKEAIADSQKLCERMVKVLDDRCQLLGSKDEQHQLSVSHYAQYDAALIRKWDRKGANSQKAVGQESANPEDSQKAYGKLFFNASSKGILQTPEQLQSNELKALAAVEPAQLKPLMQALKRAYDYAPELERSGYLRSCLKGPYEENRDQGLIAFFERCEPCLDAFSAMREIALMDEPNLLPNPGDYTEDDPEADLKRWFKFYTQFKETEFVRSKMIAPWREAVECAGDLKEIGDHFWRFFLPRYWSTKKRLRNWMKAHLLGEPFPQNCTDYGAMVEEGMRYMAFQKALAQGFNRDLRDSMFPVREAILKAAETEDRFRKMLLNSESSLDCVRSLVCQWCALPDLSANLLGKEGPLVWSLRALQLWNEKNLKDLSRIHGSLEPLYSESPLGTLDYMAQEIKRLEGQVCGWRRLRLVEDLKHRGLLGIEKPEPRVHRTEAQKRYEALYKESAKKSRHMPLRKMVKAYARDGLLDVLPCWLMSPESMVSLFPRAPVFDLVIVDEASQATVSSSLPALMRAKRVVIAGDDKQMPPSSFFSAGIKEDEFDRTEDEASACEVFDSESLLTLARSRVSHTRLSWHYRSQHQSLIAFSNYACYEGGLMTIPAPVKAAIEDHRPADDPERTLRFVKVENASYKEGVNEMEAAKMAQLMAESFDLHPKETVGIITFNDKQRQAVERAIDDLMRIDEGFALQYNQRTSEDTPPDARPFVKNIENVQGDERDAIFFSLGHCAVLLKGSNQKRVPARFGPIGQKGGERRLNVAISRAKYRCTVVCSFNPEELQLANVKNLGPEFLRLFVEYMYAAAHDDEIRSQGALNDALMQAQLQGGSIACPFNPKVELPGDVDLSTQIYESVEPMGYRIEKDVGIGSFTIPLVLTKPGEAPIAVLIQDDKQPDGYDANVHRPLQLKQKGWRVLQTNAVEWLMEKDRVIASIANGSFDKMESCDDLQLALS